MRSTFTNRYIIIGIILVILGICVVVFTRLYSSTPPVTQTEPIQLEPQHVVIGKSIEGRAIDAYTYGTGATHLLFVGGIHGGYEWNSVLLAYTFMDYLEANPEIIPENITVTIIPASNPDGVYAVTGKEGRFAISDVSTSSTILAGGRFNAHKVDLNRNFDCKWQPQSTWQTKMVSAGTAAFSEPEALALKTFATSVHQDAVIFWHSQSNAIYASQCLHGILPTTLDIMNAYSKASAYSANTSFDAYATTGAADDWLASINIPAITVELQTHSSIEWDRNLSGIKALFDYFGQKK